MAERENPISIRSKRRITEALLGLMKETSFSKITIKDIVERAGLTRQTFYHNFETKEDVLIDRIDEYLDGFVPYISQKKVSSWEDIFCCFFRYWQERADFLKLLMKNGQVYLLSARMADSYLTDGNFLPPETDLSDEEERLWFSFALGALVSMLTTWLAAPAGLSARAMARMTVSMMDGSLTERTGALREPVAKEFLTYIATASLDEEREIS